MTRLSDPSGRAAALAPVTIWDGDSGDFAEALLTDPVNPGGLVSDGALLGAITLALFSDSRGVPDPLAPDDFDLRGWPGDYFDVDTAAGEAPLGNQTWLLARGPANAAAARQAEIYAETALEPLIRQGLIGSVVVSAVANPAQRRIDRRITITRVDGSRLYSGPLAGLWSGLPDGV